jgi:hypothetical protein
MRMTSQAPSTTTARLVCELKAQGQEESHDAFDKRLAIAEELKGGGFVVKIDGDGPVLSSSFARLAQVSPLW